MGVEGTVGLLGQTRLFGDLEDSALRELARSVTERSYRKGHIIVNQGDPGDSLFVVSDGLVKVFVTSDEGAEMVLVTLKPPDVFGEVAVLDEGARSASAEALEETKVLMLARSTLLGLIDSRPELTEVLLRSLGGLVRRLTEQAADLVFLDLHGRVAKLLLNLADERGTKEGDEMVLDLHMTQSDVAGMVGGSRQSVNQILHHFQRRGFVDLDGRAIVMKDLDALRRRAGL
jgi:CRP/FNR family transcriptional regulator, cyclic AMP receptor protein